MPMLPKIFYSRQLGATAPCTWLSRLRRLSSSPLFSIAYLIFDMLGITFGLVATWRVVASRYRCRNFEPTSVAVTWQRTELGGGETLEEGDVPRGRYKVMGFVGIQMGFASTGRHRSLQKMWMPSTREVWKNPPGWLSDS